MVDIQPCSGGFSTIHFGVLAVTGGFNVAGNGYNGVIKGILLRMLSILDKTLAET
jgi:hypothetical protein